jgi:hypothetical protein
MQITGTFIDEISHDIPHQNWSAKEWEQDFIHMKNMGIDTVILIRSGYRRFITYPSKYLIGKGCYTPPIDLVELFLQLADKFKMNFYFGLYDSGEYWDTENMQLEVLHNQFVIDEVWKQYGHHPSFKGWYLSMEISRKTKGAIEAFSSLGKQPWIDGKKSVMAASANLQKENVVSLQEHEKEWAEIFDGIHQSIDAVAFQDGHVDYHELEDYLTINKNLAYRYGLKAWTNCESFDRDMPIKFLPIKFEKMKLKLDAAKKCGYDKAITFEFSHFMSPQSMYGSAKHLYNRYCETYL